MLPVLLLIETHPDQMDLSLVAVKDSGPECEVSIVRDEVSLQGRVG